MSGTIMAINAVHPPLGGRRDLLGREGPGSIMVFSDVALVVFYFHPGNHLTLLVRGNISDFIGDVHVPMDTCYRASAGAAATDIYQHAYLAGSVAFIIRIVIEHFHLRPKKLLWPVALFARLRRRTQVVNRRSDRTRVLIETH